MMVEPRTSGRLITVRKYTLVSLSPSSRIFNYMQLEHS